MSSRLHRFVRSAVVIMGIGFCAATSNAAQPGDVLISKVFYSASTSSYIELYNASNSYIDLDGWTLKVKYANGGDANTYSLNGFGIAPRGYVVLSSADYDSTGNPTALISGVVGRLWPGTVQWSAQMQVEDSAGQKIDGLAYGSISPNLFGEGSPAPLLSGTVSLARKTGVDGLQDTDDNLSDFATVTNLGPSLSSANLNKVVSPGSPISFNGKVYVGGGDSKLYVFDTSGPNLAQMGSSVDIEKVAVVLDPILSRPSLRLVEGNLYLFLTTNKGALVRIRLNSDGSLDTSSPAFSEPMPGINSANPVTPAVFPADDASSGYRDYVFFTMSDASGAVLYKVRALDLRTNPQAFSFGAGTVATSSPSMNGYNLYVGVQGAGQVGLHRVNPNTLDVLANLAQTHSVSSSPMVSHTAASGFFQNIPVMYVATDDGYVYARNADTGGVVLSTFGDNGSLALAPGTKLSHVYLHDNTLYISAHDEPVIYAVNAQTGASSVFFNGSSIAGLSTDAKYRGIRGGVVVDPRGTVCFGTSWGWFYQIPISHPDQPVIYKLNNTPSANLNSGFFGTPTIDTMNGYVLAVNSNGYLYRLPRY